jgi:hypothetical protein
MTQVYDFAAVESELLELFKVKLGVRAPSLAKAIKKSGRRMPRDAHRAVAAFSDARMQAAHPKLARMVDATSLETSISVLRSHLEAIDPGERRKDALLGFLGTQAVNVLVIAAVIIGLLYWRGFL